MFMSQQVIDIGSSPNSGNGNPLRTAWTKANANFTELYNGAVGLATDVLYVSKSGNDSNTGLTLSAAFLTVNRAVQAGNLLVAVTPTARVCIFVKSGSYTENNPVTFGPRITVWGDNLRSVSILPGNPAEDIFHLSNACYVAGMTFRDHVSPTAAVAFAPGAGVITTSPYVQNCSSITTTGVGMRINGALATGTRSMVADAFTQVNQGGIGVEILNQGYAQLVSVFTVCCQYGILCTTGGTCSVTNSNTSFGTYGLVADGKIAVNNPGATNGTTQIGNQIVIDGLAVRPNINQAVSFDGGVTLIDIWDVTPLVAGQTTITLATDITTPLLNNTPCTFYIRSAINASGHTFEYVGTGNDLTTALPQTGAIAIPANQVVKLNGGQVIYTSTDERGDFKVGDQLTINGAAGTITGETFDKSLFAVMTPYILALEG
tara:strand:- start:1219 stop:2514 length:1296 start_codon:yes stop_codon:yes gene_type:complete